MVFVMIFESKIHAKNKFYHLHHDGLRKSLPYLIPNGIMALEKIDFLCRVNFRLEKRPNLHSS